MMDSQIHHLQTLYSLSTQDITFALTAKTRQNVCGYTIIQTEHPKLFIFETTRGETFANNKKISVSNLDIFAYMNSKFVYVEKHIRTQLKQLYRDVLTQKCNLERQTLKNSLTIATQAPDEFAYNLMKGPGYMAVIAGEVVHIVKCIPVEVKIQQDTVCYAELQVTRNNETLFLAPRTHILKNKGTRITCNRLLPAHYLVGERWYKILPFVVEAMPPLTIKPVTRPTWKYTNPAELATSGIYTEKDLKELRDRIMFPVEKPSLLNDLAREMEGHPIRDNEGAIYRLLNEEAVGKIMQSAWNRAWNKFTTFGTVSAGVIAIMMILQVAKTIIDIVIRGYALHSIFGWSIHLLGAVWSSIAHFILHNHQQRASNQDLEARLVPEEPSPRIQPTAPPTDSTTIQIPLQPLATTVDKHVFLSHH